MKPDQPKYLGFWVIYGYFLHSTFFVFAVNSQRVSIRQPEEGGNTFINATYCDVRILYVHFPLCLQRSDVAQ